METELWLAGVTFPRFSSRGCTQELMPVAAPHTLQRCINGSLIYLGDQGDTKYRSVIRCEDQDTPILGHVWRGSVMDVGCISYIHQPLLNRKEKNALYCTPLLRRFIKGSVEVFDTQNKAVPHTLTGASLETNMNTGYVRFRPILSMCLVDFHLHYDEWGAKVGWRIILEEV